MNIILGATGQVGSLVIKELQDRNQPIMAVARDERKASQFRTIPFRIADLFDKESVMKAFEDGDTAFLLTPENPASKHPEADLEIILENYEAAVRHAGIKRIVGLSSIGAQHSSGTGNLLMSHKLEQTFAGGDIVKTFVRPAYYYSNWLGMFDTAKEQGVLPTFFPVNQKIPMVAPKDVAVFVANVIAGTANSEEICEIVGPRFYSSSDIAEILGRFFDRKVEASQIPQSQWEVTLSQAGFSDDAAKNMIEMMQAVIDGKAMPDREEEDVITLETSFEEYLGSVKMLVS